MACVAMVMPDYDRTCNLMPNIQDGLCVKLYTTAHTPTLTMGDSNFYCWIKLLPVYKNHAWFHA